MDACSALHRKSSKMAAVCFPGNSVSLFQKCCRGIKPNPSFTEGSAQMNFAGRKLFLFAASMALAAVAYAQEGFQLHSVEFQNDGTPPLAMILNNPTNGVNSCTASGKAGGDQSPQLFWTGAPYQTRSFVVVL